MKYTVLLALVVALFSCKQSYNPKTQKDALKEDVLSYVDPFIGTDGKGKTFRGATIPYGMLQLSPDNGRGGWGWITGYFYPDNIIAGFCHTHPEIFCNGNVFTNQITALINGGQSVHYLRV